MPILDSYPELREQLHELYTHLHQHPELSMQEFETAVLIEQRMGAVGYDVWRCGGTGVVAVLENGAGPVVGFRADTDALPLKEDTGLDYMSTATGTLEDGTVVPVMHACGHDTHITAAIGAASLLAHDKDSWAGTAVFIFQPGEETAAGAKAMVEDGHWDRAPPPRSSTASTCGPVSPARSRSFAARRWPCPTPSRSRSTAAAATAPSRKRPSTRSSSPRT